MGDRRRFYEAPASGARRSAPAALRNRTPIAEVLQDWLPSRGTVLEIASGTGEHVTYFAERFPSLDWQPSDVHPDALASVSAWRELTHLPNVRRPIVIDAADPDWPLNAKSGPQISQGSHPATGKGKAVEGEVAAVLRINMHSDSCDDQESAEKGGFDVVLNLNMVHISPWSAALGLLDGAARVLKGGGALVLYGPWLQAGVATAPSNLQFDQQLRQRDPAWGLRRVEDFQAAASARDLKLEQTRAMPANNLMLLFRFGG